MSSRSRSNDLSNLSLVTKGTSMDNLELNNKLRKSRKNQVYIPEVKGYFDTFYLMVSSPHNLNCVDIRSSVQIYA